MSRCISCKHFDMKKHPVMARLGMGKCRARSDLGGTFVTASYAHECPLYEAAPAEVTAKRIEWEEKQRTGGK